MSVYFNKKEELKEKAANHTKMMEAGFKEEIDECVKGTKIYGGDGAAVAEVSERMPDIELTDTVPKRPEIITDGMDSVKSMLKHRDGKTAVLNFASYKNPGGKFLDGSSAQEECLCHSSILYNVLKKFPDYYAWNKQHNNRALYTNRALYSEDVVFVDESVCVYGADPEIVRADVITCAAPNLRDKPSNRFNQGDGVKKAKISDKELLLIHEKRLRRILDIAATEGDEVIILGAFGCGAFLNNPEVVALAAKNVIKEYLNAFKVIEFAVYCGPKDNRNFKTFERVLKVYAK